MRTVRMAIGAALALVALAIAGLGFYLAVVLGDGQDPDVVGNPVLFVAVFLGSAAIPAALATRLITGVVVGKTKRRALIMIAAISASAITFMAYRFNVPAQMVFPAFIGTPVILPSAPLPSSYLTFYLPVSDPRDTRTNLRAACGWGGFSSASRAPTSREQGFAVRPGIESAGPSTKVQTGLAWV